MLLNYCEIQDKLLHNMQEQVDNDLTNIFDMHQTICAIVRNMARQWEFCIIPIEVRSDLTAVTDWIDKKANLLLGQVGAPGYHASAIKDVIDRMYGAYGKVNDVLYWDKRLREEQKKAATKVSWWRRVLGISDVKQ